MNKKRILALLMAFTVAVNAFVVPTFAAGGIPQNTHHVVDDLVGEGRVHSPTLRVAVPIDLHFTLDPFMMTGVGELRADAQKYQLSQIVEADFEIINNTYAPVAAVFYVDAVLGNDVTMIAPGAAENYARFNPISMNHRDRVLYLGVLGAEGIDAGATEFGEGEFADDAELTFTSPSADDDPFTPFRLDETEDTFVADFAFVLDAATEGTNPVGLERSSVDVPDPPAATTVIHANLNGTTFPGGSGWAYDDGNAQIIHAASGYTATIRQVDPTVEYTWDIVEAVAPPAGVDSEATANAYWIWNADIEDGTIGDGSLASFVFYAGMNTFAPWEVGDVSVEAVLWLTPLHRDQVTETGPGPLYTSETLGHNKFPYEQVPNRLADAEIPPNFVGFHNLHRAGAPAGFAVTTATTATLDITNAGATGSTIVIPIAGLTTPVTIRNTGGAALPATAFTVQAGETGSITFTADRSNTIRTGGQGDFVDIVFGVHTLRLNLSSI